MTQSSRRALHAYVSDEAHDQWHNFAAGSGVSVSAILEVLAPHLPSDANPDDSEAADARLADLVLEARRLDAARRRRIRA